MPNIEKLKAFTITRADAEKDIALINQYSLKELKPEDVFCFSVILCDNEVDRDNEKFTDASLETLAKMFVGKTGIKNHSWDMKNQVARLYRVELERTAQKNSLGEQLKQLRGSSYMLRTDENKALIESIEGGITKEVSVGFSIKKLTCSICGEQLKRSWWEPTKCKNDHVKGNSYDGKMCVGLMEDPTDAYEFSFVAVPAQRSAGTTKGFEAEGNCYKAIMSIDTALLAEDAEGLDAAINHLLSAKQSVDEQKKRAELAEKAKNILKGNE